MPQRIKRKIRWTPDQLEVLVDVWAKYYLRLKGTESDGLYAELVSDLRGTVCEGASPKEVRDRIHHISEKYRKEAFEEMATGKPSQWPLFRKIAIFFVLSHPTRRRSTGRPEYDMSDYLHLDAMMQETLDRQLARGARTNNERVMLYNLDENSMSSAMDVEEADIEPHEQGSAAGQGERRVQGEQSTTDYVSDKRQQRQPAARGRCGSDQKAKDVPAEKGRSNVKKKVGKKQHAAPKDTSTDQSSSSTEEDEENASQPEEECIKVFTLKGYSRHEVIEDFLRQMYSNQLYVDVMLITCYEGKMCMVPAHRMVLATFSPYFSTLLGTMKPSSVSNPLTILLQPDISPHVLHLLLQFMYTGEVSVSEDLLQEVVRCGLLLQIRGFCDDNGGRIPPRVVKHRRERTGVDRRHKRARIDVSDVYDESTATESCAKTTAKDTVAGAATNDTDGAQKTNEKDANKQTCAEDKGEAVDVPVSPSIGYDLLRSDSESDEGEVQQAGWLSVDEEESDVNDDADFDEEDGDGADESDDEPLGTEMDSANEEEEENFEMISVINGGSGSNVSWDRVSSPEPTPTTSKEKEMPPKCNGKVNGTEPPDVTQHEHPKSPPAHVELEPPEMKHPPGSEVSQAQTGSESETAALPQPAKLRKYENTRKQQSLLAPPPPPPPPAAARAATKPQSNVRKQNVSSSPSYSFQHSYAKQFTNLPRRHRPMLECAVCGQRFDEMRGWVEHVVYEHVGDDQLSGGNGDNDVEDHIAVLQCHACQKYYGSEYDWVQHILHSYAPKYPHLMEHLTMPDDRISQ